jgi:tRNA 2-thiouridine synthesizing protein C
MYGEDVEPALLLMNEGVVALARECKPERLGLLSVKMVQRYVKRYGTPVYAVGEDLDAYGVRDVDEGFSAQTVGKNKLPELFRQHDYVIFM